MARTGPGLPDHALTVRAAILELLPRDASLPAVAKYLRTAERTLQRRLAARGTSHAELVESVRRDLARERVASSTLTVSEVAGLLGYADASAFARAFRRWFGASPAAFRKSPASARHHEGGAGPY